MPLNGATIFYKVKQDRKKEAKSESTLTKPKPTRHSTSKPTPNTISFGICSKVVSPPVTLSFLSTTNVVRFWTKICLPDSSNVSSNTAIYFRSKTQQIALIPDLDVFLFLALPNRKSETWIENTIRVPWRSGMRRDSKSPEIDLCSDRSNTKWTACLSYEVGVCGLVMNSFPTF